MQRKPVSTVCAARLGNAFAINAAVYFPRLRMPDPLSENRLADFAPCGAVAGIMARTDVQRGVWKAPAGLAASLSGVQGLTYTMTDRQNGVLNPVGLNCLRTFPVAGHLVWGARTLAGADLLASEWKYVPVRRLALFLEESLFRGTQWVVFEPNDEPLWAQIRLNIGAFMQDLFRQGAFQGSSPRDAYFVKCDRETTTQSDINRGGGEHPGRFRSAQTRRVRGHQAAADGRTDRRLGEQTMAQFSVNAQRFDPSQELQIPGEVGRPLRRRDQQGRLAQAQHRNGRTP